MTFMNWLIQNSGWLSVFITGIVGVITIVAIIFSPIIALKVQKEIEETKEKNQRKLGIFKTLMATRAARLSPAHVEALNMIDIEFYRREKIIESWRSYQHHLNSPISEPVTEESSKKWLDTSEKFLIDLLSKMSDEVGYSFDRDTLKKAIYFPRAHGELEQDQIMLRKGLLEIISKGKPLTMNINSFPINQEIQNKQNKLQESLIDYFDGKKPVKVEIQDKSK